MQERQLLGTGFKHHGQHENCYTCKLQSLTFNRGQPKTHTHKGGEWPYNGDPVVERITEFQAAQAREEAQMAANAERTTKEQAAYQADQGVTA